MDDTDSIKWVITKEEYSNASLVGGNEPQKIPTPKYSALGEKIRHVAPSTFQCSMFCGGKQCKYCNPVKFKKEPNQDAVDGLYSAWVTPDILATSRPSTAAMKEYKILEQFHKYEIRSIINLQHPGEHAACGFGLKTGGFTYVPQDFMDNDVFFYNFGWNDYGVRSLQSILDMVKVFDFALSKGKTAVHCHAGLGRTGVLIACYLIYATRLTSHEAIVKVREARPKAIQTRGQINCVNDFAAYIKPMWKIFSDDDGLITYTFTLKQFMHRQRNLLHGEEARTLRFVPKIIFAICSRLLLLAEIEFDLTKSAIVTHFGFMRNNASTTKNEKKNNISFEKDDAGDQMVSNQDADDDDEDSIEAAKARFPIEEDSRGSIDQDELRGIDDEDEDDSHRNRCHSDEEVGVTGMPKIGTQFKARSTPNVPLHTAANPLLFRGDNDDDEYDDDNNDDCHKQQQKREASLKKGGIQLEPLTTTKTTKRKKKKKGLQDRIKELKEIDESSSRDNRRRSRIADEDGEFLSTSLPPVLRDGNSGHNNKPYINGIRKMKNVFKPDQISLASFSSTANEGLYPEEIVLKHLAFRTSDLTTSTQIERYKRKINSEDSAWDQIGQETNTAVLTGLFWSWLSQLQSPILSNEILDLMQDNMDSHENIADQVDRDIWKTLKFIIVFLSNFNGKQEYFDRILRRLSVIMTNDDFPKDAMTEGVSIENTSPGLILFRFVSSWLTSMKS